MDILYLLIPLSAVLVLLIGGVLAWAAYSGQFEGLEHEGRRILAADDGKVLDLGQSDPPTRDEQSAAAARARVAGDR
ncbi:MAG: cbb3-type cytochrome oxidase assembly protein CcoS [Ideonella sp.]|nr:cbb3-type cytochrome oxidase assembly protein CcoS [Ideonella sp.]MCC7457723.1 cbb3-type cytochrome oxidase assembly protein CcoS [Nitrospira sp.]